MNTCSKCESCFKNNWMVAVFQLHVVIKVCYKNKKKLLHTKVAEWKLNKLVYTK